MNSYNHRVSQAFRNQKVLEGETRKLQISIHKHHEQNKVWLDALDEFNDALKVDFVFLCIIWAHFVWKELGDVPNAAAVIERDIKIIRHVQSS